MATQKDRLIQEKLEFSRQQGRLMWSRVQTLIALQAGVLAGAYKIREEGCLAVLLLLFGAILTGIVWLLVLRDRDLQDKATEDAGEEETSKIDHFKTKHEPKIGMDGVRLLSAAFGILLFADALFIAYLLCDVAN